MSVLFNWCTFIETNEYFKLVFSDDEGEPDSEEEEEEEVEEEEEEEDGEIKETEEEEAKESVLDDSVQEQSIQEDPLKELNACLSNLNTEESSKIKVISLRICVSKY